MNPMISVIVPIYKVEEYLRPCVDSILQQTYTNLEIILVDDGSPDGCGAICDAYLDVDSRIKVIHKKNGGLSDARNVGMAASTGAFLSFVDSDDLLPPNALEDLLEIALRENAEMVIGGHNRFEDEVPAVQETAGNVRILTPTDAMEDMLKNGCASWARIYRREIHADILFPKGEINEDDAIVLHLLEKCSRVAVTDTVVYHYRCRPESITTSRFSGRKLDWYRHCVSNYHWIKERHPDLLPLATDRLASCVLFLLDEIAVDRYHSVKIEKMLLTDLRKNYSFYKKHLRIGRNARIRLGILRYLPFGVYRAMRNVQRSVR